MKARSRSACGEAERLSAVPQIGHITSSSTSGRVVLGWTAWAAPAGASGAAGDRQAQRDTSEAAGQRAASSLRLPGQVGDDVRVEVRRRVTGPEAVERRACRCGSDEERLGNARRPQLVLGEVAASVAKLRIGDPVPADEAQRVAAEVVGVDPEDREVAARRGRGRSAPGPATRRGRARTTTPRR